MQTVYNVVNRFMVDDQATRAMDRIAASAVGLNGSIYATRTALGSLLTMSGVFAAAYAFLYLKRGLYDYNNELEQAEIALGAIFNAGMKFPTPDGGTLEGIDKFNNALGVSQKLMQDFQLDAALSVGTTMDFVNIAKQVASPLMNMGKGVDDLREFVNLTVAAASVLGVDFPQASRDMMSSLTGTAGIDVKLFRLLNIPGGAKVFNQLAPTERYDMLVKEMGKYKIAADAFALSNKGLASTITDLGSIFLGKVGRHAMETWKQALQDLLTLTNNNKEAIDRFQNSLGSGLSAGLQGLINSVKWVSANKEALMTLGMAYAGYKAYGMIAGDRSFIGFGRNVARRMDVAAGRQGAGFMRYPMLSIGNALGLFTARDMWQGFKAFPMLSMQNLFAPVLNFMTTLGRLVRYFTIAGVVVMFFAGIFNALRTNFDGCFTAIYNAINKIIGIVMRLAGGAGSPLGSLFSMLMRIATVIGAFVINAIAAFIDALGNLVMMISKNVAGIVAAINYLNENRFSSTIAGFKGAFDTGYSSLQFQTGEDYLKNLTEGFKMFNPRSFIPGEPNEVPQNNTTINGGVHIYQEFKENHEPDRIAFATVSLLNKLAINPVQPKRAISLGGAS